MTLQAVTWDRLFDRSFYMPEIDRDEIENAVGRFRRLCKEEADKAGIIFPIWHDTFADALGKLAPAADWPATVFETQGEPHKWEKAAGDIRFEDAVYYLLSNPRILKSVLRRVWAAWEKLRGEIVLDELLLFELVRQYSPRALGRLHRERDKDLPGLNEKENEAYRQRYVEGWFEDVSDVAPTVALRLWVVCRAIRPDHRLRMWLGKNLLTRQEPDKWQAVYRSELPSHIAVTDQQILHDFVAWKRGDKIDLVQKLHDEAYSNAFHILFDARMNNEELKLTPRDILRLTDQIFERMLKSDGANASRDTDKSYYVVTGKLKFHDRPKGYVLWVWKQIKRALSTSLSLAWDIEHDWAQHDHSRDYLVTENERLHLRRAIRAWIQKNGGAEWLARGVSNKSIEHTNLIRRIISPLTNPSGKQVYTIIERWRFLIVNVLTEALKQFPSAVLPTALSLIFSGTYPTHYSDTTDFSQYNLSVNRKFVCLLFNNPNERQKWLEAILKADGLADRSGWGMDVRVMVEQVITDLRKWRERGYVEPEGE